jgi:protein-arginine kinase activator protein McsA
MGLFDKKICGICNKKIGVLDLIGSRKLEDSYLCKDCAKLLSPWFSDNRKSTLEEIREQLSYRELNKEEVDSFNPTRTLGQKYKVMIDDRTNKFCVTKESKWREANPDILKFSQVTGCDIDIKENKDEIYDRDSAGNQVSFNPRQFSYKYSFGIVIHVNHKYFSEMKFDVNNTLLVEKDGDPRKTAHSTDYEECRKTAEAIKEAVLGIHQEARTMEEEAEKPKAALVCPFCGATTIPDAAGNCEYCGACITR